MAIITLARAAGGVHRAWCAVPATSLVFMSSPTNLANSISVTCTAALSRALAENWRSIAFSASCALRASAGEIVPLSLL